MGDGYSTEVKSQKLISAKICLDFNFRGVGEGGGYSMEVKSQKILNANICLKFELGEGGILWKSKVKNF